MTDVREVLKMTKVALKAAGRREKPEIQKDYPEVGDVVWKGVWDARVYPKKPVPV